MMPPRIDMSRPQIERAVATFYARIRTHDELGPIFNGHIQNWPEHEEKISRFWASAILFEGSYEGNPMRAHMHAGDVVPAHFASWLSLFDEVLAEQFNSPQREQWSELAHRMGTGLSGGLADARQPAGAVPRF
jgi:hemoglobin